MAMRSRLSTTARRLLLRPQALEPANYRRLSISNASKKFLSTNARGAKKDASQYITGVTNADVENNPNLAAFFAANYPEYFEDEKENESSSTSVEDSVVKEKPLDVTPESNIRSLFAYKRTKDGTNHCYRLRDEQRLIPGTLYGSDPTRGIFSSNKSSNTMLMTPLNQIVREMDRFTYHRFESRVYDLTLLEDENDTEGQVHRVMPRDVQHHPVDTKYYCVNYLRYFPGRPIKIPITYINEEESPALKRGGFIAPVNRYVTCVIDDGVPIPEALELECSGLALKEVIRMDRILFPEGVRVSSNVNVDKFLVGTCFGRRILVETETVEEEEQS